MNKQWIGAGALLAAIVVSTGCEVRESGYYGDRWHRHGEIVVQAQVAPAPSPPSAYVVTTPPPPPPAPVVITPPAPPPPAPVVEAPPPPADQVTVIASAPPPAQYDVQPAAPGIGFIWTPGYWVMGRGGWLWVRGRWARPPHPGAVWVPQHWDRVGGRYHFSAGYWR